MSEGDRLARGCLVAALVLSLCRLVGLSEWSLWHDEALTLSDSLHLTGLDNPLGYGLVEAWVQVVGPVVSPGELRFPAAVIGILCVPLAAWALVPVAGRAVASGAALVLATSSWHLYWSQNARFYTLAQALVLLGIGLFLRGFVRADERRARLFVYGSLLPLGLAALAHPSAVVVAGALFAAPFLARWLGRDPGAETPWRALKLSLALGGLGAAAWVARIIADWAEKKGDGDPLHFVLSTGFLIGPPLGFACCVGAFGGWREGRALPALALLVVALGGTAALLGSTVLRWSAQYVFVLLPLLALGAALPLAWRSTLAKLPFLLVVLFGLADQTLYLTLRHGDRPRWREAFELVHERLEGEDLLLAMEAPVGELYLDPRDDEPRIWRRVTYLDSWRADLPARWARYPRRIWIVLNREQLADWRGDARAELEAFLREDCQLEARFEVPLTPRDLDVEVWLRP